ncbi:MAG: histidine phosphatase family protein [Chitinophagaceae bacterium]|nr:histidine phosphatase family protein [Chitinophagaceae bacterium]
MKTLLLIRHAKSSWENFTVTDQERPLNERGKKNAPEMAARLLKRNILIDSFLSSPAKRALATAKLFAGVYDRKSREIIVVPELYLASSDAFTKTILHAPEDSSSIALFSHNAGITEFANSLSGVRIDHMPTCSVFAVKCPIASWAAFETGKNEFYFFDYPRSH